MERIGVRELRQSASEYLARVEAGESLEITRRGRVVAVLVPAVSGAEPRTQLLASGRLLGRRGDLRADLGGARPAGRSISAALHEQREER